MGGSSRPLGEFLQSSDNGAGKTGAELLHGDVALMRAAEASVAG
jgi:hypothetical protein